MPLIPSETTKKKFYQAVGRRKTARAQVRIWTVNPQQSIKSGYFVVNGMPAEEYFQNNLELLKIIKAPVTKLKSEDKFCVSAKVEGGGKKAQAEAVRHGFSRALVKFFPNFRKRLKRAGYLTRDPRMKERKKYGLKKARRAPQWQKR